MVRMHVGATPVRFDASRILAFSPAIALHLLALALLLVPLSQVPIRADAVRETPRWTFTEVVPVTPVPAVIQPPQPLPAATVPKVARPALPELIQAPDFPVFAIDAAVSSNRHKAAEATATESMPTSISPVAPLQGVSLQYLSAPAPAYPIDALRSGAQGTVVLRVLVDETGAPIEVKIERSSGNRSLDNAARSQVARHWRFRPAVDNGRAVQAYGFVPIDFRSR